MATAHIQSNKEDIAKTVIMPGDPLRAKMIAETYLTDVKLINTVRNIYGYTGFYKGKEITVFASGMGIPSAGIYIYELFHFYDVEKIIRIGTCGSNKEELKLLDVILVEEAYSLSSFPKLFNGNDSKLFQSSLKLNQQMEQISNQKKIPLHKGLVITSDVFDVYVDFSKYLSNYPEDIQQKALGAEMESFVLFYLAEILGKQAACLLTVVDSHFDKRTISSEERQGSLNKMIEIALESTLL